MVIERVAGRVHEGGVAGHRRDPDEIGVARRGQDRHDVVVAGIAVEQDRHTGRHQGPDSG